jgi:hypothetical protein
MMETVCTCEMSVCFNETKQLYVPEGCGLHTCHHENLKSHKNLKEINHFKYLLLNGLLIFSYCESYQKESSINPLKNYALPLALCMQNFFDILVEKKETVEEFKMCFSLTCIFIMNF